jgi:hypothetical protein
MARQSDKLHEICWEIELLTMHVREAGLRSWLHHVQWQEEYFIITSCNEIYGGCMLAPQNKVSQVP